MTLETLTARIASINDILCAANLLIWDSRTMMPQGGAQTRGHQIGTLTRLARDTLAADATLTALEGAEREVEHLSPDADQREAVRQVRAAVDIHRRVPVALIEQRASLRAMANAAWTEARADNDFPLFAPWLERTVQCARDYAQALGYSAHPYDALIGIYEPGETVASLRRLFGELKAGLKPILAKALQTPPPARDILRGSYPIDTQLAVAAHFAKSFGYDFDRGRLDTTVHPFEISLTRGDVRITTRCNRDFLRPALFGAFHETGHALYEQNVSAHLTRTVFSTDLIGLYAVGGTSFGVHESQSRLWENHVGRSPTFWRLNFHHLQKAFPAQLANARADELYAAVTRVSPGLIRTDADELTYDFHIMLRVELEAALMAGDIKVRDIPDAWHAAMQEHLGLKVPSNREGCLQDIHWSSGMLGSFCSYTIGNVMAAQLFAAATADDSAIGSGLERGDYAPLSDWLRHHVWRHGRRYSRETLLQQATGRGLEAKPYLVYLAAKYAAAPTR